MAENLDGPLITQWARRAAAGLRERQAEINRMNVFPIPDSDTGSNMAFTMSAAIDSADQTHSTDLHEVTTALASGAVRGARGNSGMVLSQVLRALADTASRGPVDSNAVARMLGLSVDFVKTAIAAPVEGTILTVLRAAAEGAATGRESLKETVGNALEAAEIALERTPDQLDALAKAGVVDAGGRGLVVILQSLYDTLDGGTSEPTDFSESFPSIDSDVEGHGTGASELEVMFMFDATSDPSALGTLRTYLDQEGTSVVVAEASENLARVHVHTHNAGAVIEKSFALGDVSDLRLEVLPESETMSSPIIALAPAGGAATVFESAGAMALDLEQADDATIQETLTHTGSGAVIVLTNGRDSSRVLNKGWELGWELSAVNTTSLVGGLAALAVHDPSNDFDDDVEDMIDAVSAQRFTTSTALTMIADLDKLLEDGGELVTLLWSEPEVEQQQIEELRDHVASQHPEVEFHDYRAPGMAADNVGHVVEIGVE